MKVICKCCFRPFDYDMYMGLCPKCGRVYRREKGMYSEVEKDMVGDFHIHTEEGGLNRGIDGVVYNQPGSVADKNKKNGFDEEFDGRHYKPVSVPGYTSAVATVQNKAAAQTKAAMQARSAVQQNMANVAAMKKEAQYYSPNHKTQLNKSTSDKKNSGGGVAFFVFILFIIIGYLMRYFS